MAIGWLAVLKMVPWADVISAAPAVADGAKKLWDAVARKPPPPELPIANAQPELSPELRAIATLEARLASVQAAASELHDQMLASSELIKVLADQNAQLIKRVEINRVRVLWLAGATVVLGIVAAASLGLTLLR